MIERNKDESLDELNTRLKAAQARQDGGKRKSAKRQRGGDFGPAVRVGVDLVSGVIVGVLIGLALDHWLDTSPWLMVVFFILGSAAGITNVMRSAHKMEAEAAARRNNPQPKQDETP